GPDDPMVELEVGGELPGGLVVGKRIPVRAVVHGGVGSALRLVDSGEPLEPIAITSDPFVYETTVLAKPERESFLRAEVLLDESPRTVTNHVFLRYGEGIDVAEATSDQASGCGCRVGSSSNAGPG